MALAQSTGLRLMELFGTDAKQPCAAPRAGARRAAPRAGAAERRQQVAHVRHQPAVRQRGGPRCDLRVRPQRRAVVARRSDLIHTRSTSTTRSWATSTSCWRASGREATVELVERRQRSAQHRLAGHRSVQPHHRPRRRSRRERRAHRVRRKQGMIVRYRICGVLETGADAAGGSGVEPIRNRFKIMARADISVQHGRRTARSGSSVNGRPIDVRLSTLPTVNGEKIVMRVIDSHSPAAGARSLGYDDDTLARLKRASPGPTAWCWSPARPARARRRRSTAALAPSAHRPHQHRQRRGSGRAHGRGVTQIPVNTRAGNTFPTVLRSRAAPGSERDHGRRDPRRRSGADRRPGGLHRPSRAELAAHHRRRDRHHPAC